MISKNKSNDGWEGKFFSEIAFQVRTQLNAIIGLSDLITHDGSNGSGKAYAGDIYDIGRGLGKLIDDAMSFSKMQAGEFEVELGDCSLQNILEELNSMVLPLAVNKGLEFKINLEGDLPANIVSNFACLRKSLFCLLENAIMRAQLGTVCLNISAGGKEKNPMLKFDVEVDGAIVLYEKNLELFEEFERFGRAGHDIAEGLRLSVIAKTVGLLGGKVIAEDVSAGNAVFTLEIPAGVRIADEVLLEAPRDRANAEDAQADWEKNHCLGHVLVAEDDHGNREILKRFLEMIGLQVSVVSNGKEAVTMALEGDFDLVMSDIRMPGMDGDKAVKAMRDKGLSIPVIAITADEMSVGNDGMASELFNEVLVKPFDMTGLYSVLRRYLPVVPFDRTYAEQSILLE